MYKILIVEDHDDIRRLIRTTIDFDDCEIHEARMAVLGLEIAIEELPHLMLIDVMMPGGMDGLELCRRVKASPCLSHTKVVFLSARGMPEDKQQGMDAGADAYLVKPFSPLELIKVVEGFGPWHAAASAAAN